MLGEVFLRSVRAARGLTEEPAVAVSRSTKAAAVRPGELGNRIPVLDGIRGVAILLVMVHHMTIMEGRCALDRFVAGLGEAGWIGVDLFFVLSGFLITGILYDSKGSTAYFRNFYARRTLRIFPLYYGVLIFSLLILPQFSHPKAQNFGRIAGDELWYWLYLSNYAIGFRHAFRHGILDVSWSLAIEEQFYLIWPAIVLWFDRRKLMGVCVGMVVASFALRLLLLSMDVHPITIRVITPTRMDGLAMGAWIALAARGREGLSPWVPGARIVALLAGLSVCGIFAVTKLDNMSSLVQGAGYLAVACFFASVLLLVLGLPPQRAVARILRHPVLTMFGRYSYALYLFHLPVRAVIRDTVYRPEQFFTIGSSQLPGQLCFYGIATAASLVLALLSWNLYEKHFLKLKERFPVATAKRSG